MRKRLTITLPEETIRLLDNVSGKGNRSRFIEEAVKRYAQDVYGHNLPQRLKEGALARAKRDRKLAKDWFGLVTTSGF